jgi:hypothetical protein
MSEENKARILVTVEDTGEKFNIEIGLFPNQRELTVRDTVHCLTSAVSLLIKSSGKHELGIEEHELMKEVIDHLNMEFMSNESFSDLAINGGLFKKNPKD